MTCRRDVTFTVYPLLASLVAVYRLPYTVNGKRLTVNETLVNREVE